jgi:hypothetical protein
VPLDEGNGGGTDGTSLRLLPGAGGRWTVAHGAAARSFEGGRRPQVGQAGPNGLMTHAGKENSRKKKKMDRQGILGRIGNGLASVEIKRKENGLLKKCGPRSSWAVEKFLFKF